MSYKELLQKTLSTIEMSEKTPTKPSGDVKSEAKTPSNTESEDRKQTQGGNRDSRGGGFNRNNERGGFRGGRGGNRGGGRGGGGRGGGNDNRGQQRPHENRGGDNRDHGDRGHDRGDNRGGGHQFRERPDRGNPLENVGLDEVIPKEEKKFTGRCRLFVGNITPEMTEENFKDLFTPFGEISEVFVNGSKGFGFIRMVND